MNRKNSAPQWQVSFILLLLGLMTLGTAVMMNLPHDNNALALLCVGLVLIMIAVGQYWHEPINHKNGQ